MMSVSHLYGVQEKTGDRIYRKMLSDFTSNVFNKYGLSLSGSGGGQTDGKERLIKLVFSHKEKLELEQMKLLHANITRDFLLCLNSNEQLKGYLIEHPFPLSRIEIRMSYSSYLKEILDPKYIAVVSGCNNIVRYSIYNHETDRLEEVARENYQDLLDSI